MILGATIDCHDAGAWVLIAVNAAAGLWALAAHRWTALRGRPLWAAIILAQLQQAHAALGQQGFQMIDQPYSGGLRRGERWNVPAHLQPGVDYRIVGVCDRDCADLDLVVFDPQGAAITQDTSTTSQPVVGVQPGYAGAFTVQVLMYNCTVEPCYYAIALYGRPMQ